MASTLKSSLVILMIIALATHHAHSQLSTLATGLSRIIKILEKNTNTSSSFIPDIAAILSNQEMLLKNSSTALDEMSNTLYRIEKVIALQQEKKDHEMNTSTQAYQDIASQISSIQSQQLNQMISVLEKQNQQLENISSILPNFVSLLDKQHNMLTLNNIAENSAVSRIVTTQSLMADSLDKIVTLLQIKDRLLLSTLPTAAMTTNISITQPSTVKMTTEKPTVQPPIIPTDCSDISEANNHGSRVYTLDPGDGLGSFDVYCNMDTDEGGWTVFQKRFDGSVDFFLGWDDYENGFGSLQGEHWLGLEKMHRLTRSGRWTLRIDLEDFDGNQGYALYGDFQIGDAQSFYRLSVGAFSGDIRDSLTHHNGQSFTTRDQDHDDYDGLYNGNCALYFQGAWWYSSCHHSNLNGLYRGSSTVPNHEASRNRWGQFPQGSYSAWLKKSEMKMRQTQ